MLHDIYQCASFYRVSHRPRMCFAMMELPEELVEKILLQLDPASVTHFFELGLGDDRLNGLLSNPTTFLRLLGKLQFLVAGGGEDGDGKARRQDNRELVVKISSFIRTAANPGPLLASLQEAISLRFPPLGLCWLGWDLTVVLERLPQQPLIVDYEGVLLLLHAREGLVLKTVTWRVDGKDVHRVEGHEGWRRIEEEEEEGEI